MSRRCFFRLLSKLNTKKLYISVFGKKEERAAEKIERRVGVFAQISFNTFRYFYIKNMVQK